MIRVISNNCSVVRKKNRARFVEIYAVLLKVETIFVLIPLNFRTVIIPYDKVIVYYDNGQRQITRMLNAVLATELSNYEMRKVHPVNYSLFQAADLLCTVSLLQQRYKQNNLTRSDLVIFHSRKDLYKDFLKRISMKEFKN